MFHSPGMDVMILFKENNMVDKMATLCLMAGPREMANGAAFYEEIPGHAQTAVMLYHKVSRDIIDLYLSRYILSYRIIIRE